MSTADPTPQITYGVQWRSSPGRESTVLPSRDAATAHWKARRVRALQRVFGNPVDAAAVYRLGDGEWQLLLPAHVEKFIAEFREWLNNQAAPPTP